MTKGLIGLGLFIHMGGPWWAYIVLGVALIIDYAWSSEYVEALRQR